MIPGLLALVAVNAQAADIVLHAGHVLDVKARKTISDCAVVVSAGKITGVFPWSGYHVPDNATVVDLHQATVLPGLIDAHTHLLSEWSDTEDPTAKLLLRMSTASRALLGARVAREMLHAGFTMVRDLGNSGVGGDLALRDAINTGWAAGPRMLVSTRAISPPGGQIGPLAYHARGMVEQEYVEVSGADEARRAARQAIADGADVLKIIVGQSGPVMSKEEIAAVVDEARRADRGGPHTHKVAAHAFTDFEIRLAVDGGVDSIEHGYSPSDETLKLMAERKIYLVPTDETISDPLLAGRAQRAGIPVEEYREQFAAASGKLHDRIRRAIQLGVPIAWGSDNYVIRPGMDRGQAGVMSLNALREAGLSAWDVLAAATTSAAALLGWGERTGSIQPGYTADIIAVNADPLSDDKALTKVVFVMKSGVIERRD